MPAPHGASLAHRAAATAGAPARPAAAAARSGGGRRGRRPVVVMMPHGVGAPTSSNASYTRRQSPAAADAGLMLQTR